MITVDVQRASQHRVIPNDEQLYKWVNAALATRVLHANVSIRIVDTEEMTQLNRYYRGKDKPTNVLSFPMSDEDDFLGDIVVCAPVVMEEAQQQNKAWEAHWAHLVIHGCLHLLGFDHETPEQAAKMEPLEVQLLAELGYPNPY